MDTTLLELQDIGWAEFMTRHQIPIYDLVQDNDPESFDSVDISHTDNSFYIDINSMNGVFPQNCGLYVITDKTMIDCSEKTVQSIAYVINDLKQFIIMYSSHTNGFAIRICISQTEFAVIAWTLSVVGPDHSQFNASNVPVVLKTRSYRTITPDDMKKADLFILNHDWISRGNPEWIKHCDIRVVVKKCHMVAPPRF
jgi:hypothetical protein